MLSGPLGQPPSIAYVSVWFYRKSRVGGGKRTDELADAGGVVDQVGGGDGLSGGVGVGLDQALEVLGDFVGGGAVEALIAVVVAAIAPTAGCGEGGGQEAGAGDDA